MTSAAWDTWGDVYARLMAPVMTWICDAAALAPGLAVLDLGCGTGQPALLAAARVRPGGRVVAIEVDPVMRAATTRRAREAGLDNLEVREADMNDLSGFADASFDAVTSGYAFMFSSAPERVAAEIRRVLVPGGRLALCVWDELSRNPFFATVLGAAHEVMPDAPLPQAGGPGPFRLSPPGELERVLVAGGLTDVRVQPLVYTARWDSVEQHWDMLSGMVPALHRATLTLPPAEIARLRAALTERLQPYLDASGGVSVPAAALVATARRA